MIGLAEALFDNDAEWPDELAFKRGDYLRILDQNPAGGLAEGWWVCADQRGKRGIAPANRLKMLHNFATNRSRVITPRRIGDVFSYGHSFGNMDDDDFFSRPMNGSDNGGGGRFIGNDLPPHSSFDVLPPKFPNFHLLHDSDHPFTLENGVAPFELPSWDVGGVEDKNKMYSSIVRNVPIRVEGRVSNSSADVKTANGRPATGGGAPQRKSPPPPPQRRHFYVTTPLVSSLSSSGGGFTTTSSEDEKMSAANLRRNFLVDDGGNYSRTMGNRALYDSPSFLSSNEAKSTNGDFSTYARPPTTGLNSHNKPTIVDRAKSNGTGPATTQHVRFAADMSPPNRATLNNSIGSDNSDRSSSLSDSTTTSGRLSNISGGSETYDVPSSSRDAAISNELSAKDKEITLSSLTSNLFNGGAESLYDRPKNNSAAVGLLTSLNKQPTVGQSKSANDVSAGFYDVPSLSRNNVGVNSTSATALNGGSSKAVETKNGVDRTSTSSAESDYQELKGGAPSPYCSSSAALTRLAMVESNLSTTTSKLANYVSKNWRRREFLESHLYDIRLTCRHVLSTLKDYVDFCSGCFVSLTQNRNVDGALVKNFAQLLQPLRQSLTFLSQLQQSLESSGWMVSKFLREGSATGNDNLDQFIAVARRTPEDTAPASTYIKTNAMLIFEFNRISSKSPQNKVDNGEPTAVEEDKDDKASLFDDYDFIDGPSVSSNGTPKRGEASRSNGVKLPTISMTNGHAEDGSQFASTTGSLNAEDKQILSFYSPQIDSHMECLSNAIDDFLAAIERNEPPKVFVGHSRFVILAAHKLVYIGDSLAHCLKNADVGEKMKESSDRLCDVLKQCVTATKQASLQYPAVTSVQAMVDCMVSVSHVAHDLKLFVKHVVNV